METSNKDRKDAISWQQKAHDLTYLTAQLKEKLKKYEEMEKILEENQSIIAVKDSLVMVF